MYRTSFFKEESLPPKALVVQGVKVMAVILALCFCHATLPDIVKETVRYLIERDR